MKDYTPEEIELIIKQIKEEVIQIYENKPLEKEIIEIDKKLLLSLLEKFESAVVIKFLMKQVNANN